MAIRRLVLRSGEMQSCMQFCDGMILVGSGIDKFSVSVASVKIQNAQKVIFWGAGGRHAVHEICTQ
jgi:hypothetical protein